MLWREYSTTFTVNIEKSAFRSFFYRQVSPFSLGSFKRLSWWSTVSLQWFYAYIYLYLSFTENILVPGYFLISGEFAAHYLCKYCLSSILSSQVSTPFSLSLNLLFIFSISLSYLFGINFSDILFSSSVLSSLSHLLLTNTVSNLINYIFHYWI